MYIDVGRILTGSVVAGFGLSAGRDLYREAKKNFFLALIAICLIGIFFSGIWLARQYETIPGAVFARLGALIVLIGSFCVVQLSLVVLLGLFGMSGGSFVEVSSIDTWQDIVAILATYSMMTPIGYMFDNWWYNISYIEGHTAMLVFFWVEMAQLFLFLVGVAIGSFQREWAVA